MSAAEFTRTYRRALRIVTPVVRRWGRLEVVGLEHLPATGPVLLVANHDSNWDPVVIGVAAARRRQVHAVAKHTLWRSRLLGRVLDGMGQIPIRRGAADTGALDAAIDVLHAGGCVGIFPEGTLSHGRPLRARSGAGRIALAAPAAVVVCAAVTGAVDLPRCGRRPRLRVEFFPGSAGDAARASGDPSAMMTALMDGIRQRAPFAPTCRDARRAR